VVTIHHWDLKQWYNLLLSEDHTTDVTMLPTDKKFADVADPDANHVVLPASCDSVARR